MLIFVPNALLLVFSRNLVSGQFLDVFLCNVTEGNPVDKLV